MTLSFFFPLFRAHPRDLPGRGILITVFALLASTSFLAAQRTTASADLSSLTISKGTLTPAFDTNTIDYDDNVPHRVTTLTVTPTAADTPALITVNGEPVASGSASQSISLQVGSNTVTILVSEQDETHRHALTATKTYTIAVNRGAVPVVTTINDGGIGSLRDALSDSLDGETINFSLAPSSVITLTSGELVVGNSVTIAGNGANVLTVTRNSNAPAFRVFHVLPGKTVTINGLTIGGGLAQGNFPANYGGGIYNDHSTLTVNACALNGNSAGFGGAIMNDGFYVGSSSLTVTNSTLSDNAATSGGAIFNYGELGGNVTLNVNNCTLSANIAESTGGAIYNDAGSNNGGAATLNVANTTFSANTLRYYSSYNASGIYNSGGAVTLGNTILNKGNFGVNIWSPRGYNETNTSAGYNLSDDDGGGFLGSAGDQINTDPMLGPLRNNGGTTKTHTPLVFSPAIDQGKRNAIPTLTTNADQRGLVRPVDDPAVFNATGGDASDIGAVELAQRPHAVSAGSRKTHGLAEFDVPLPLSEGLGVECRTGGINGVHRVVLFFSQPVTFSGAAVISGTGSVTSVIHTDPQVDRADGAGQTVTISLTGVSNQQTITVGLFDVNDGTNVGDVGVRMGILVGDTNGDGAVNSADIGQTKSKTGQALDATNFRQDVNVDALINSADISLTKSRSGTSLP